MVVPDKPAADAAFGTICPMPFSFALLAASILTNCADIAALPPSPRTASRTECARLTGQVVKHYSGANRLRLFLRDGTGISQVTADTSTPLADGDIVRAEGPLFYHKYMGGLFVRATNLTVVGHAALPPPVFADFRLIRDGELIGQEVSVSGVVVDAFQDEVDPPFLWLLVRNHGVTIPLVAKVAHSDLRTNSELIGSEVTATGFCAPPNGRRRFAAPHITLWSFADLHVARRNDALAFDTPEFNPSVSSRNLTRYRKEGRVRAVWGGNRLFLRTDDNLTVEVHLRPNTPLPTIGAHIRVAGFAEQDVFFSRLVQAIWKPTSGTRATASDVPQSLSPHEILGNSTLTRRIEPKHHGSIVRIAGTVRNRPTRTFDETTFYLESEDYLIPIDVSALADDHLTGIVPGTKLAVVGACLMEYDDNRMVAGFPRLKGFSLVLRSPNDVTILKTPPWWTPLRLMVVIGVLLAVILAIGIWNRALKVLSERRGRELMAEQLNRASADLKVGERTRLAVELHDALSQNLTGVSLQLDAVKRFADEDRGKMARHLDMAMRTLKSCRDELRNCLWDLRNRALEEKDMNEAIRRTASPFVGDAALLIRFNVPRDQISDNTAHALMRIVRELATNAVRHGGAKTIRIAGALENGRLLFSVSDDGRGFDPANHPGVDEGHFGLDGIRDRVSRFDGALEIESAPGRGATIRISMTA